MGLNAVVYKNAKQISPAYGQAQIEIDPTTGEVSIPASDIRIPRDHLVASEERLGNTDEIRFIRAEVERILENSNSILLRRILYSASHSGDVVPLSELPALRKEVAALKSFMNPQLKRFLEAMELLIQAGITEENPIVFE